MAFGADEALALLRWKFIEMSVYIFHCPVLADKFARSDFSDSFDSRNVVRRVSADCKDFYHLLRRIYSVFLADFSLVQQFVFSRCLAWSELEYMI